MKAVRIKNQALVREILLKDDLWEAISEDGSIGKEDYFPDVEAISFIALTSEGRLHGFVVGRQVTDSVSEAHIAIDPALWGHKDNVELGKLGCKALFDQDQRLLKLVASIPVTDHQVLRFAQRVGFQREGVNRKSFLRKGEVLDQFYVGLCRPQ